MTYTYDVTGDENPFSGQIFTDPAETTERDWAKSGCFDHVDYTDDEIDGYVFLAILSGDAKKVTELTGKKDPKVLNAGPEDTVFTYFIDHGDNDIIGVGWYNIHARALLGALETAHDKQLYGKWLWYIETCHSGSMFTKLPSDWNIYVMTSADADHNAEMSNCPPDDVVAGKPLRTCLSGLWDNSYLDYMEAHPDCTIGEVFDFVHEDVAKESDQNVSEFGDMTFRDMKLSDFVGYPTNAARCENKRSTTTVPVSEVPSHLARWDAIRADENNRESALQKYQEITFEEAKKEVEVMRLGRLLLSEKAVVSALKKSSSDYSVDCVRELTLSLSKKCGHSLPLPIKANNLLRNICASGVSTPVVDFSEVCMQLLVFVFVTNNQCVLKNQRLGYSVKLAIRMEYIQQNKEYSEFPI